MSTTPAARYRLYRWSAHGLKVAVVVFLVVGVLLIRQGAYPPPGEGTSGHAVTVLAGTIVTLLSFVSGLLAFYFAQKAKAIAQSCEPGTLD